MAAYVIAHVEITDPEGYKEYVALVPETLRPYGGRFIARGGRVVALEGGAPRHRLVIIEFPSLQHARDWYDSPEYAPAKAMRQARSRGELTIVEGI